MIHANQIFVGDGRRGAGDNQVVGQTGQSRFGVIAQQLGANGIRRVVGEVAEDVAGNRIADVAGWIALSVIVDRAGVTPTVIWCALRGS